MSIDRDIDRDAARYRWLRRRLEVCMMEPVSGVTRPALDVRLGCEFLDITPRPRASDASAAEALDAAIDVAMAKDGNSE